MHFEPESEELLELRLEIKIDSLRMKGVESIA